MAGGILILDKAADWTSHDVVAKVRRILSERRVGHGGTLDPMATGLLPVFVGRATRGVEFAVDGEKEYHAGLRLGVTTDTQDTTGTVLETRPVAVRDGELEEILGRFRGEIAQIPPMYSALKREGKRLYELARAGVEIPRDPRPVTIRTLELLERRGEEATLRVVCSKGTYIRTLCHDIGTALGCGGAMYALRRTRVAGFDLTHSVTIDALLEMERPEEALLPIDRLFLELPSVKLDPAAAGRVRNGTAVPSVGGEGRVRLYGPNGEFLALAERRCGVLHTIKSFFEV